MLEGQMNAVKTRFGSCEHKCFSDAASVRKMHHYWSALIKICVKVPMKLFGQMDFKFFCSFP